MKERFVAQAQTNKAVSNAPAAAAAPRNPRRITAGMVTSASTPKTCRVQVDYLMKHARYSKYLRRRTVLAVHDEKSEARPGDRVEIMECRPMSRTKRWRLVRIVQKAPEGFGVSIVEAEIPGAKKKAETRPAEGGKKEGK
jgi:small subunit ribosomal protein S17